MCEDVSDFWRSSGSDFRPLHGLKEVARFGGSAILEQPTEEVVPGVGIA